MSVVGSISRVSEEKLEKFKTSPNGNPKFEHKSLFLDSFFWDLNYILTKYSGFDSKEASRIILGTSILRNDELHLCLFKLQG